MDIRGKLVDEAQDMLEHLAAARIRQAPGVMTMPADMYTDPELFQQERVNLFRRVPLMLAASCEIPAPGDYKAMTVAGVPVLLVRGKDGTVRAFLNSCRHRGVPLTKDHCGHAARFTCPYHAWTYGLDGALRGVAARQEYGDIAFADNGLLAFPAEERAGLVWVILDTQAVADFDVFLGEFGSLLAGFDFGSWHYFDRRVLPGANWKLAFDAHLDFYHLPVLHRNTFGPTIGNLAQYYYYGPHQRLGLVSKEEHKLEQDDIAGLAGTPCETWPLNTLLFGEWIVFPNVSINCFYKGGRGVIISQIFPGERVGESVTIQTFLHEKPPEGAQHAEAAAMAQFLTHVVGEEDLPLSMDQQRSFESGLVPYVQFGRNEGGLQHFHYWLNRFVSAPAGVSTAALLAD